MSAKTPAFTVVAMGGSSTGKGGIGCSSQSKFGKYMVPSFDKLTARSSMNTYLLAPPGVASSCSPPPDGKAPTFNGLSRAELREMYLEVIGDQPRTKVVDSAVAGDEWKVAVVQRTALLRFPDVITAEFLELAGSNSSTLAVFSTSIYGQGDLGANQSRVDAWMGLLAAAHVSRQK